MSRIKKTAFVLILTLLSAIFMPTAAFGASEGGYTVEKINYTADLLPDGGAVISEDWQVTFFDSQSAGFSREILLSEDNFIRINGIYDVTVTMDDRICSEESSDTLRRGSYFLTNTDNAYIIKWCRPEEGGSHSFSLRYTVKDAVKLYRDEAYYTFRIVNGDSKILCRNITAVVNAPASCFPEDFEILQSGSLAGEKADGKITFTCTNSVGAAGAQIKMPKSLFNESALVLLLDDTSGLKIAAAVLSAILFVIVVSAICLAVNYKRLFRKHWLKQCNKSPRDNNCNAIFDHIFGVISPAELLNIISEKTVNAADIFVVTALELVSRGYIRADRDDFCVVYESETDKYGRPLNKSEKQVLDIFSSDRWQKFVRHPRRFYQEIEAFNSANAFSPPFFILSKEKKELFLDCFEVRVSAKRFEYVSPMEISDSIFRNGKYGAGELVVSLLNEYDRLTEFGHRESNGEFRHNMFMFRDIYNEGKAAFEAKEQVRKNKKRKHGDHDDNTSE